MRREERERAEATEAKPAVNRTFKMATALSLVLFVTLALVTFAVVTASMMVDGSRSAGDGADEGALHNPLIGTAIASVVLGGALGTWQSRRIIAPSRKSAKPPNAWREATSTSSCTVRPACAKCGTWPTTSPP